MNHILVINYKITLNMAHMWVITLETWEKILLLDSERVNKSFKIYIFHDF